MLPTKDEIALKHLAECFHTWGYDIEFSCKKNEALGTTDINIIYNGVPILIHYAGTKETGLIRTICDVIDG